MFDKNGITLLININCNNNRIIFHDLFCLQFFGAVEYSYFILKNMCPPYIDVNWRQSSFPDSHFYYEWRGLKYVLFNYVQMIWLCVS